MFKTILKTLALSATTLTLLSACGASDSLNTAIGGYEANLNERGSSGFRSAGSGKELGSESASYISIAVHPGTNTYIMDPPFEDAPAELPPLELPPLDLDPSPFNMVSARVASFSVVGQYGDNGTARYHGDNIYNITRGKTQDTFGLVKNQGTDANLIMIVNGVEYDLIPERIDSEAARAEGVHYSTSAYSGEKSINSYFQGNGDIKEIIRGTHATIQGDYVIYATDTTDYNKYQGNSTVDFTRGVATIGIQTPASVVDAQTAVATYNGSGYLYTHAAQGVDSIRSWMYFQIAMNVDFDANTIAGTGRAEYSPYKITFNSAPIVGNGFEGTFTMNDRLRSWYELSDNPTGQYGGNFFGPNADDLAGTMRFNGTASDHDYRDGTGTVGDVNIIAVGGFRADRVIGN